MKRKCQELISAAIDAFYEAKTKNKDKEKLYFKGLSEGMMKIARETEALSREDIDKIIDEVKQQYAVKSEKQKGYDLSDIDTPTFIRDGKDIGNYLI